MKFQEYSRNIAKRLKEIRQYRHYTQDEVAKLLLWIKKHMQHMSKEGIHRL